jgi:hypothetical protein
MTNLTFDEMYTLFKQNVITKSEFFEYLWEIATGV